MTLETITPHASRKLTILLAVLLLGGTPSVAEEVILRREGGVFIVDGIVNGRAAFKFVLDSGASETVISSAELLILLKDGTIGPNDILPSGRFTTADGRVVTQDRVRLKTLQIGNTMVENVEAAVVDDPSASLLLGQSFLSKLKGWSIDNRRQVLTIAGSGDTLDPAAEKKHDWKWIMGTEEVDFFIATDAIATRYDGSQVIILAADFSKLRRSVGNTHNGKEIVARIWESRAYYRDGKVCYLIRSRYDQRGQIIDTKVMDPDDAVPITTDLDQVIWEYIFR